MAKEYLGTGKLEIVIDEGISGAGSTIENLFSTMLALDLSLPKQYQYLRALIKDHAANHRFLAELIFVNIFTKLMLNKHSAEEEEKIKKLILDAFEAMSSITSKREREASKTNLLNYIEKKKLLKNLRVYK